LERDSFFLPFAALVKPSKNEIKRRISEERAKRGRRIGEWDRIIVTGMSGEHLMSF